MKSFRFFDYSIYLLLKIFGFIASLLSPKLRGWLASTIGSIIYALPSKRKSITLKNLLLAFPEKSLKELRKIAKHSFQNLMIVFVETAALEFFTKSEIRKLIKIKNIDLVNKLLANGNGLIFLSAHYGNWEYSAIAAGIYSQVPITVVVQKQKNKYIDKAISKARTKFGNKIVLMNSAARSIIQAIRNNEAIALLVDQSAKFGKDSFVDFFGLPALTYDAPAELALRFRTPIVYGFAERNKDYTYTIELKGLYFDDLSYSKENVKILSRRHVEALEKQIKKRPELWAWQHRRWKHTVEYKKD